MAGLSPEDCQLQSMPHTSPVKWHLAHTTWFFETLVLELHEPQFQPFDATFRHLFNSYYLGVGSAHSRSERGLISRPDLAEVLRYRAQVDARMHLLLSADDVAHELRGRVELGLQHEQQHQELLQCDLLHALSRHPARQALRPAPAPAEPDPPASPMRWQRLRGGLVWQGWHPALDGAFAFDNETPRHRIWLQPFEIADRLVSNAEFLRFMAEGGYQQHGGGIGR